MATMLAYDPDFTQSESILPTDFFSPNKPLIEDLPLDYMPKVVQNKHGHWSENKKYSVPDFDTDTQN